LSWRWLLALGWLLCCAAAAAGQEPTAPFPRSGDYAGAAECIRCHEGQHKKLVRAPHGVILGATALPGCETCHGPGHRHAAADDNDPAAITMPAKLDGAAQERFCGRCHVDQIARHGGDMAGLRAAGKACTDCHEVHARPARPVLPGARFLARTDARSAAEPIGSAACVACHPLRDDLLQRSVHAKLAAHERADGCELCHGNGALHAASNGLARLITRPDRAADGAATCRLCHATVDQQEFHWRGRRKPFLAAGITCATCHRVHEAKVDAATAAAALPARIPLAPSAQRAAPAAGAAAAVAAAPATNRLCATCHVPALCTMPGSTHALLGGPDLPLAQGCGSCHRGGEAHARAAGRRDLVERLGGAPAAVQAAACLQCHRKAEALRHVDQGVHQRRGVGCVDCHGPLHGADPTTVTASAESNCQRCHAQQVAEFRQPNHHPVPEGRMQCSSCHEVHGARPRVRDLELCEQKCVECHAQYRGPFVYAHQASRRDGCVVCHVPHGSPNRRLLQQTNSQQNCLQCHGDFPVFHDQTPGAVFTDCMHCHTEVHGSNHSRFLFR
jgi:DmsE family decaheme c-type cytochrome